MAGNSITPTLIDQMAAADASQIRDFLAWLERRIYQWSTNCGTNAQMTALGYSNAQNQAQILQLIANLNTLNSCFIGGQTASNTHDMRPDLADFQGIS
ncbi:MAG: hypothetical protein ACLQUY_21695 [Ktedonobacterales bacterium]